jgi:hypothetical protein
VRPSKPVVTWTRNSALPSTRKADVIIMPMYKWPPRNLAVGGTY